MGSSVFQDLAKTSHLNKARAKQNSNWNNNGSLLLRTTYFLHGKIYVSSTSRTSSVTSKSYAKIGKLLRSYGSNSRQSRDARCQKNTLKLRRLKLKLKLLLTPQVRRTTLKLMPPRKRNSRKPP